MLMIGARELIFNKDESNWHLTIFWYLASNNSNWLSMKKATCLFLFAVITSMAVSQSTENETIHLDSMVSKIQHLQNEITHELNAYFHYILEHDHTIVWEDKPLKIMKHSNGNNVIDIVRKGDSITVTGYTGNLINNKIDLIVKTKFAEKGYIVIYAFNSLSNRDFDGIPYLDLWAKNIPLANMVKEEVHGKRDSEAGISPKMKPLTKPRTDYSSKPKSSKTSPSRHIYTGPRGGRYYINSKGNKVYIKK